MGSNARKLTDEQIADLRARRAQSETLRALGKHFGVSHEGVRITLIATGGDPKPVTRENFIGRQFHRWTVIADAPDAHRMRRVLCRCDCGNEEAVYISQLKYDGSKSCGCYSRDRRVEILSRWLTFRGRTKPLKSWCRELGLKRTTVSRRLNVGWSVEKALGTPLYGRYGGVDEDGRRTHKLKRKLNEWSAIGIMAELLMGCNSRQLAERRGVSRGTIDCVWYGRTWRDLFEDEKHEDESANDAR